MRGKWTVTAAVALAALVGATPTAFASHLDGTGDPTEPIEDPIPGQIRQGPIRAQLQVIAFGSGLTAPLYATYAPAAAGQTSAQQNIIYVVDQDGLLWAMDRRTGAKSVFLNTRPFLMPIGAFGPGTFDERGFLGVAFHPDYQVPGTPGFGKIYTYTSEPPGSNADIEPDHFNVVREWQALNPLTPPPVFPGSEENDSDEPPPDEATGPQAVHVREVMRFHWPQFNHNGGAIFFGTRFSDRRQLYVTLGDGGCADDQNGQIGFRLVPCTGHGPGSEQTNPNRNGNGQGPPNPLSPFLAKIIRFDPFAPVPQVVATGLRNPWRASSDRADLGGSGDLWFSDVGQNHLEEVDHLAENDLARPSLGQTAGNNFGWHFKEGTFLFNPFLYELLNPASDGFVYANAPGSPPDMTDPMAQYDHDEGTAVIGGFVYRGKNPGLQRIRGRYVFGDYSRRFLNGNGEVFWLDETNNCNPHDCTPRIWHLTNGPLPGNTFMLGFGEDVNGEIFALANETGIPFEETGLVMRLVPECSDERFVNGRRDNSGNTCRD